MISISDSDEFRKLVQALADDIVTAHIHWRLHCDLVNALNQKHIVHAQSPTFWHLTVGAHEAAAIGSLCRAFDQERAALHLRNWLETIRENRHLFETGEFRKRLAANPYVDTLAQENRVPDEQTLADDIAKCSASDPTVKKLVAYRNSAFAHRGATVTLVGRQNTSAPQLSVDDVQELLARARAILSRYTILFGAEVHSTTIIGHDDFDYIFRTVEAAVLRARGDAAPCGAE